MIGQYDVLWIFGIVGGIIIDGHFVYASGKHGSVYVNKDAIYPHTTLTSHLCRKIASRFMLDDVDVVVAPAIGGVILSQWTAHHLTEMNGREVFGVYAEKSEGGEVFSIKRGYDKFIAGKRVLVVEDVLTTGNSVKKVVNAVRAIGGNVIGVGALWNRGNVTTVDVGDVPKILALLNIKLTAWDEKDCPLCAANIPINANVGSKT